MKMVVGHVALGIMLVFMVANVACGPGNNAGAGGSGGGGGGDSFAGDSGVDCTSIARVELAVSSPLPTELGSGCAWGDVTLLDVLLNLSKVAPCDHTFNCSLATNVSGVSGPCPEVPSDLRVPSNETYAISLFYRATHSTGGLWTLAVQSKNVEVPATASDPFPLPSFANEPLQSGYEQNLTDWCNGNF